MNQSLLLHTRDPHNEKAEPILREWRDGSTKLKEMLKELNKRKDTLRDLSSADAAKGRVQEKESRQITSSTYEMAEKRLQKEIEVFLGVRKFRQN